MYICITKFEDTYYGFHKYQTLISSILLINFGKTSDRYIYIVIGKFVDGIECLVIG